MNAAIGVVLLVLVAFTNGQVLNFRRARNPQCDITPPFRGSCGERGISEEDCTALDCCYGFDSLPGIPRCYNKKGGVPNPGGVNPPPGPKPPKMKCDIGPPFRTKCADDGISKEDCLAKKCCYGFDTLPGIPRCYHQG